MANKEWERLYATAAANLLGTDWLLVDIPEPLDFEVCTATERFGLEVRQVFVDEEMTYGSPAKWKESKNLQAIAALAKRYYEFDAPPISAKFRGSISPAISAALVESMVAAAPSYPGQNKTIYAHGVKIFMTPLPVSFPNPSRWTFVEDRVGWPRPITAAHLQHAINRKEANLALYKQKYDNIELLLVADRTFQSGMLVESDDLVVNNPGFRAIYFMSYPESIQPLGYHLSPS